MRVTKEQAALNRQRILDSAIRLFGERGVDRVGVAEVMADAGFTHGGFYNHFSSKDELVVHAVRTSFERSLEAVRRNGTDPERARPDSADFGECLNAAMLSESATKDGGLSEVYADGLRRFLDVLAERFGDRRRAADALARYVGTRVLWRAVESSDPALAGEFTAATTGAHNGVHRSAEAHSTS
ncbi:TetR family transcriptional regulator [Mycobacterium sp. MYCO198283]|uniref:TetR/AcrR family transcriptional regulator n=1 Tax=Mycobacterium sp. MYCO198283 TaxID=2883505 RepID=UPI001E4998EE|nr:TetR family transcriptional regulator [Mycobacterium sp. MYCO198283]MCG5433028.1 TetR family transcriptional regulator [Mycobacterium sp. MYCO198283]